MPTHRRLMIACAAAALLGASRTRAAGHSEYAPMPRSWTFWTAGELQSAGSVGPYDPAQSSVPGLGAVVRLHSPSAWVLRAQLEASRGHTSYTDIAYGPFVIPTVRDESDMVWALAGPQWEAASWRAAPHVYALAGAAVRHTRLHPEGWTMIFGGDASPWLHADVTAFATAIGTGVRFPMGASRRLELTADTDYRWTAPIDYVTSPVTDPSGNHLATKRSSVHVVTIQLGVGARWGGD